MTISRRGLFRLGAGAAVAGAVGVGAAQVTEPVKPPTPARQPAPAPMRAGTRWTGDPVDSEAIRRAVAQYQRGLVTREQFNHMMNICYCGEMSS
jgi:hypothetical protein